MSSTVRIKFTRSQPDGSYEFRDALVLPADHGLTKAELTAMEDARYAAHLERVLNPPPPPPPDDPPQEG